MLTVGLVQGKKRRVIPGSLTVPEGVSTLLRVNPSWGDVSLVRPFWS